MIALIRLATLGFFAATLFSSPISFSSLKATFSPFASLPFSHADGPETAPSPKQVVVLNLLAFAQEGGDKRDSVDVLWRPDSG